MSEPILPRAIVAQAAERAAREYAETRSAPVNPYPVNSDAAAAFEASLARYLHEYSAPTAEASA